MPDPPVPFDALTDRLAAGELLYRVFRAVPGRTVTTFNPGVGAPTRFGFFGDPPVPVLYAGASAEAAVAESLLHDVPLTGGVLLSSVAEQYVAARLRCTRPLRLAQLHGFGLRRLGVSAGQVTDTPPTVYSSTVRWAAAAHAAGFDGVSWMSAKFNSERAFVLFGDRVAPGDLAVDPGWARAFATVAGREWLARVCEVAKVLLTAPSV